MISCLTGLQNIQCVINFKCDKNAHGFFLSVLKKYIFLTSVCLPMRVRACVRTYVRLNYSLNTKKHSDFVWRT